MYELRESKDFSNFTVAMNGIKWSATGLMIIGAIMIGL